MPPRPDETKKRVRQFMLACSETFRPNTPFANGVLGSVVFLILVLPVIIK